MYRFLMLLMTASVLPHTMAGQVGVGFKVGSPLKSNGTQGGQGALVKESPWTVGPSVEVALPWHFAVEFNALYKRSSLSAVNLFPYGQGLSPYLFQRQENTNTWDLPLLLKYRFAVGPARPFVSGGYQWSHQRSEGTFMATCTGSSAAACQPADFPAPAGFGEIKSSFTRRSVVAGVGLEFKTRYATIVPEVRVNRPVNGYPKDVGVTGLVGFRFGK